jgi:predicted Zn-dependent peptidase
MNSQSNAEIASLLGAWELTGTGREQADTHIEALRALTPAQVSTALGRWLRGVQFTVLGAAESVQGADFISR